MKVIEAVTVVNCLLCFGVVSCITVVREKCDLKFKSLRFLENNGFHRKLIYSIDVITGEVKLRSRDYDDCTLGVEQTLPSGLYASPDEVPEYYDHILKSVTFISPPNTEAMSNEAKEMTVLMLTKVKYGRVIFTLPLHARYAPAVPGGGFLKNIIPVPKLYFKCPKHIIDDCDFKTSRTGSTNKFCLKYSNSDTCPWKEIPTETESGNIEWLIPRGNTKHYDMVTIGTVVVTAAGTLYLLRALHEYSMFIKKNS